MKRIYIYVIPKNRLKCIPWLNPSSGLFQSSQVDHVLRQKQGLFQCIGYVAGFAFLEVPNGRVQQEWSSIQLKWRIPCWNSRVTLSYHLCTRTLGRGLSLHPFGDFCPFLGFKLFGRNNFAFFGYFLHLFIPLPFFVCLIGRKVGGLVWIATSGVDLPACDSSSSIRLVFFFL